ncbi:substrate-binding domain-containing protein [Rhodococcus triatomae]|nr:substrate-binding domain-containing protein [Rhodococcus triatomae]QNG25497.1 substrate-binding domain-containing protein [Rhodococcus triatomae]
MVIPLQGTGGIFGPSCRSVAELASHEINESGGILGREVELVFVDSGRPDDLLTAEVDALIRAGRIDAITGWHISSHRHLLADVVRGRIPYIYTALYEGGETRPGVFASGEVPGTQVAPAFAWLGRNLGLRDWAVVGHDYVWPRTSAAFVRTAAPALGMRVHGAAFATMGDEEAVFRLVDHVEHAAVDGVAMFLVGQDAVVFNREFARRGLHERTVRFSPLMDENMLLGSGDGCTESLFSSAGYFRSLVTADTLDLQSRYLGYHGAYAPALNNTAESCYEGMVTLARLVDRAGSTDMDRVNAAVDGLAYDGPRGVVEFRGAQGVHDVYLAKADGYDFDVVAAL